jgi:hypothetical protein
VAAQEKGIHPGDRRYYKGIYPVKVVEPTGDGKEHVVQAERPFLDTSNYSQDKKPVKAGETFTAPGWKLWPSQRRIGR